MHIVYIFECKKTDDKIQISKHTINIHLKQLNRNNETISKMKRNA